MQNHVEKCYIMHFYNIGNSLTLPSTISSIRKLRSVLLNSTIPSTAILKSDIMLSTTSINRYSLVQYQTKEYYHLKYALYNITH